MSTTSRTIHRARGAIATLALLVVSGVARAEVTQTDNCPGHLFAIGSRLGWAEALARNAGPESDATMFTNMIAAGSHAQAANASCAQGPPPWPIYQNWRQLQGSLTQMIDEYRRGLMNRSQLALRLAAWQQGMARDAAFRGLGDDVRADPTCDALYIRIGAALAYAQTTTQIAGRLTGTATNRLQEARALVQQSTTLRPQCRNMSRLIADIDEAMRHPADASTVQRVNDLWSMASLINRLGPEPVPPPPPPPGGNIQDCDFHFWATGSRLGWAESLAEYAGPNEDNLLFEHLVAAGLHVQAANAACAQEPPPWPAWSNWREVQSRINQIADMYRRHLMPRSQLVLAIRGLRDALAGQLAYRFDGSQVVQARTCGELDVRIGAALAYAQTTTQIHRRLIPAAAEALRVARQLIDLSTRLVPPCRTLEALIPAINQTLNGPGDESAVGAIDDIWRRGSIIKQPLSASWPPPPPPRLHAGSPPPAAGVVATGGLDAADVVRRNNRLINDFGYRASSYEAGPVTLEVTAPAAAGQPYTARITSQVNFTRHLLHPQRPGDQFEEWWQVTVTLGPGQGSLERLEGPASAIEDYRSLAPDRTNRKFFNNERWYALRQPDGTYRLTMPGIIDGVPFILVAR